MLIKKEQTETYIIREVQNLDPLRVYVTNFKPGHGKIVIECVGRAWSASWPAMSGETVQQFFVRAPIDYLFDNLMVTFADEDREVYITRIINAVKKAFRNELEAAKGENQTKISDG